MSGALVLGLGELPPLARWRQSLAAGVAEDFDARIWGAGYLTILTIAAVAVPLGMVAVIGFWLHQAWQFVPFRELTALPCGITDLIDPAVMP